MSSEQDQEPELREGKETVRIRVRGEMDKSRKFHRVTMSPLMTILASLFHDSGDYLSPWIFSKRKSWDPGEREGVVYGDYHTSFLSEETSQIHPFTTTSEFSSLLSFPP